jgi:hypothetical protein
VTRRAVVLAIASALTGVAVVGAHAQSDRVALQVRPTKLGPVQNALLLGGVSSGGTGETVVVQAKDCGLSSFRNVLVVTTGPGGRWQREYGPGVNTVLRARWRGVVSAPVAVSQAPLLQLDQLSSREYEVGVGSVGHMWRKRVKIQRRTGSSWETLRSVVLTETYSSPGQSGVWTDADFTLSVPVGSVLRAVLPADQARPCYLPTASSPVRTQG